MEAGPKEAQPEAPLQEPTVRERNPGGLFYECINCGS